MIYYNSNAKRAREAYDDDRLPLYYSLDERMIITMKKTNPYLLYYFSFAIVCCVVLSVIFLFINYQNINRTQTQYNQEKLELVCDMWETHMERQREFSYLFSSSKEYQPYYFGQNKYYELELLEDFAGKEVTSVMGGEAFLYYGNDVIFRSEGLLQNLEEYLKGYDEKEKRELVGILQDVESGTKVYAVNDALYFVFPVRVTGTKGYSRALYCYVLHHEQLDERIQIVTGGIKGAYTIYMDGRAIFNNGEELCFESDNGAMSAVSKSGKMQVFWLPGGITFPGDMLPLQILLLLSVLLMVFVFASYFAWKSYLPVKGMAEKYKEHISVSSEMNCKDSLEELDYIISIVLKSNIEINEKLVQEQVRLKKQILRMILNANYSFDIGVYSSQIRFLFPGTYYFVACILPEKSEQGFPDILEIQLEMLNSPYQGRYISVLQDLSQKECVVLCGMNEEEQYEELKECVREVVDSFEQKLKIGYGKVYGSLSRVAASYLESMDNIHKSAKKNICVAEGVYDKTEIYKICREVASGNEENAMCAIYTFIDQLRKNNVSLLMQQYIFSNFLSEIMNIAFEKQIELEQSTVSLLISSRNMDCFLEAAGVLIHDFCIKLKEHQENLDRSKVYQIYNYISSCFKDYDISIEKIAEAVGTNTDFVRKAVKEKTGKSYKDYLIFLRIEYAKELLAKSDLPIAEICEKVGYGNISYFIRLFRTTTGMPPATWRNSLRKQVEE